MAKHPTFIKKWLNIPSRGVTSISIFHPYMLNVKQPSRLYLEGHAGNFTLMKMKADTIVKASLDSKIARESKWTNKSSTVTKCDSILATLLEQDKIFLPKLREHMEFVIINYT